MFSGQRSFGTRASSTGTVLPFRASQRTSKTIVAARHDDDAPTATHAAPTSPLLRDDELTAIEVHYATTGMTAVQIVEAFTSRGIKLSEASFRKYVQQGLLPRSRRVGRKGKHRGSLGVYPAKTVRRINRVKQLMSDGHTIEEIQGQFLAFTDLIENVSEGLTQLWARLDDDIRRGTARELSKELGELRRDGDDLVKRADDLAQRVAAPRTDNLRLAGAAGSAEDLF
nr:MerR family transcriptional regulator [Kofleriaceae bacterium]